MLSKAKSYTEQREYRELNDGTIPLLILTLY